jgi:hypothetical protein
MLNCSPGIIKIITGFQVVERRAANTHATDLVKLCDNRHQTGFHLFSKSSWLYGIGFYHPTGISGKIANVMVTQNRNFFFARIASAVLSFLLAG